MPYDPLALPASSQAPYELLGLVFGLKSGLSWFFSILSFKTAL